MVILRSRSRPPFGTTPARLLSPTTTHTRSGTRGSRLNDHLSQLSSSKPACYLQCPPISESPGSTCIVGHSSLPKPAPFRDHTGPFAQSDIYLHSIQYSWLASNFDHMSQLGSSKPAYPAPSSLTRMCSFLNSSPCLEVSPALRISTPCGRLVALGWTSTGAN